MYQRFFKLPFGWILLLFVCLLMLFVLLIITMLNMVSILTMKDDLNTGIDNIQKLENKTFSFYSNLVSDIIANSIQFTERDLLKINKIAYYSYYMWNKKYKADAAALSTHEYNKLRSGSTTDQFYDINYNCDFSSQVVPSLYHGNLLRDSTSEFKFKRALRTSGFFFLINGQLSTPYKVKLRDDFSMSTRYSKIAIEQLLDKFDRSYNYTRVSIVYWKTDATANTVQGTSMVYPGGCNDINDFRDNYMTTLHNLTQLGSDNKMHMIDPYYNVLFDAWILPWCVGYFDQSVQLRSATTDPVINITVCIEVYSNEYLGSKLNRAVYSNEAEKEIIEVLNSYVIVLYKDKYVLNYHGNWTNPYNLTDLNNPLFERYTGFSSLYEEYTFDPSKYTCPTVSDINSGVFLDVDTFINEIQINTNYKFRSCVNSLTSPEFQVFKDLKFIFYFPRSRLAKVIRKIKEKSWYNMTTISIFAIILVFMSNAILTCFIYREQLKITQPLNSIIEYSKNLKGGKKNLNEEEHNSNQFWDDITKKSKFHTIDLVQLFKSLLFRDQDIAKVLYETSSENYKEGDKKNSKRNKDDQFSTPSKLNPKDLDNSQNDMLNNSMNKNSKHAVKHSALQEQIIMDDLIKENDKYDQNPYNDIVNQDDDTDLIDWPEIFCGNSSNGDDEDNPKLTDMGMDFDASNIY